MCAKLPWNEIQELYPNQWVELIDYDWDDGLQDPQAGVVLFHSTNRNEFNRLILTGETRDSAIVFTGGLQKHSLDEILSCNMHRIEVCDL